MTDSGADGPLWTREDLLAILEFLPNQLTVWDRDVRLVMANRASSEWIGRPSGELVGLSHADLVGPDVAGMSRRFFDLALTGEVQRFERTVTDAAGLERTFEVTILPVITEGEVIRVVRIDADVTDSAQALSAERAHLLKEALAEDRRSVGSDLDARLCVHLDAACAILTSVDQAGDPGTAQLTEAAEAIDAAITDLRAAVSWLRRAAIRAPALLQEHTIPGRPALDSPRQVTASRTQPDRPSLSMSLSAVTGDLLTIVDQLPWVTLWGTDLTVRFANRAAAEGLGHPRREDLIGRHFADVFGPALAAANLPTAKATLAGAPRNFYRQIIDGSVRERSIRVFYEPVLLDGEVHGIVAMITDVTLPQTLISNAAIDAIRADRDRIAEDIHDLVIQRLFGVSLALDAIRTRPKSDPGASVQEVLSTISAARQEVADAVHDVHGLADLATAIKRVTAKAAESLGFTPTLDLIGAPGAVPALIAAELLPVLTETLSNVVRHAAATDVRVMLFNGAGDVWLRVADNGLGIGLTTRSSGLANIASRAHRLNGSFALLPNTPTGTIVEWRVPV